MMPHQNIVSLRLAKCVLSSPHQCIRIRHLIIFQLSIGWNLDPLHFWPNKAVTCSTLWQLEMPCGHMTEMMYSLKTTQDSELRWDRKMLVLPRLMLLALGERSPPEQCKLESFHGLHNLCSLHITPAPSLALTCTMSSVLLVDLFWFLVILRLPLRRAPFAGFSACCCCNCTSEQRGAPLKSQMVDQKKQIFSGQLSRTPLSSRNNRE